MDDLDPCARLPGPGPSHRLAVARGTLEKWRVWRLAHPTWRPGVRGLSAVALGCGAVASVAAVAALAALLVGSGAAPVDDRDARGGAHYTVFPSPSAGLGLARTSGGLRGLEVWRSASGDTEGFESAKPNTLAPGADLPGAVAVPEPPGWAVLLLAVGGVLLLRRRR